MAYGRSVFPENGHDDFKTLRDLPPSRIQDAQRLNILKAKESLSTNETTELNRLIVELQDYIISPERWNQMGDALISTQKTFSENIEPYMNAKKIEMTNYTEAKKTEMNTSKDNFTSMVNQKVLEVNNTVDSGKVSIQSTKDSALISIEQKKENIITYMDSTTAGSIRNDIGIVGDLTTSLKGNLVVAINELNEKSPNNASTSTRGIVQLNDTLNSPNVGEAATANAVKQTNDKIGSLNSLNKPAENIVEALNNIKGYTLKGTANFNSTLGTVISHSIGHLNYIVLPPTPTQNPNGYLGEVWVEKAMNSFVVKCSGTATTAFNYIVFE